MYKMPTKKDKTALEAIEAALDREKAEARAAAARHKLTVERLRCRVKTLEVWQAVQVWGSPSS
jgi:syndecan 1